MSACTCRARPRLISSPCSLNPNDLEQETDSVPEKDTRAAVFQTPGAGKSNGQTFIPCRENLRYAFFIQKLEAACTSAADHEVIFGFDSPQSGAASRGQPSSHEQRGTVGQRGQRGTLQHCLTPKMMKIETTGKICKLAVKPKSNLNSEQIESQTTVNLLIQQLIN